MPTISLDELVRQQRIETIDILKMDLQGGEAAALEGARGLLEAERIAVIFSEVLFAPHYEGAALFHQISEYLARFHYSLYNVFHLTQASNGQLRFGDALYVSNRARRELVDSRPPEP